MNKKLLITIGIILVVIGGFAFVVMRRAALEKQLGHPASFREFLGLGDKTPAKDGTSNGLLSSLFNNTPQGGTGNGPGGTIKNAFAPLVSLFTSAPTAVDTGSSPGAPSDPANNPWFNTPTSTNPTGTPTPPACSDVDLTIEFTPSERDALAKLATEFNAISKDLYDDDNVAEELNTYSAVATELGNTRDLRQYCEDNAYPRAGQTTAPGFVGTNISHRVPTPFWSDARYDTKGFLSNRTPQTNDIGVETINPQGTYADYDSVENNFKLNIW